MTSFSTKTAALSAVLVLGSLMSGSASACVVHTAERIPVMTKDGVPVLVKESVAACLSDAEASARAKAAALAAQQEELRRERTVYFESNKSALTKKSKAQLGSLAAKLSGKQAAGKTVTVVGFADRMGNAAYNERLALKRAKTVRDFLVAKGVKAKSVEVRSLGKSVPKADCADTLARADMVACLQEDRRVEIEVR